MENVLIHYDLKLKGCIEESLSEVDQKAENIENIADTNSKTPVEIYKTLF